MTAARHVVAEVDYGYLSLYPLDPRCVLLTNIVWDTDANGTPCLHRQKL